MIGDEPSRFGQQRMWGAVGWGTFAVITGFLVDEISRGSEKKDYTVMFYLMLVMLILDVVVSSRLKVSVLHILVISHSMSYVLLHISNVHT